MHILRDLEGYFCHFMKNKPKGGGRRNGEVRAKKFPMSNYSLSLWALNNEGKDRRKKAQILVTFGPQMTNRDQLVWY